MEKNTLNLEAEVHHFSILYHFAPGAIVPKEAYQNIKEIALQNSQTLSEAEQALIVEILEPGDLSKIEPWKLTAVKKALYKANVGVYFDAGKPITFDKTFRLPRAFVGFTGRNDELIQLQNNLSKQKPIIQRIVGTGGIGKSQLANYFARKKLAENYYQWVVWLRGGEDETSVRNNLFSQFVELGLELGIEVIQSNREESFRKIYKRLTVEGHGLVVFDDIPTHAVLATFLPANLGLSELEVLITTRNSRMLGSGVNDIILNVFTLEDAKNYINVSLKEPINDTDAALLADTLGQYPLALTQALAYINDNQCSVNLYCERYQKFHKLRELYLDSPVNEDDPYEYQRQLREWNLKATIWAVVQLSLERVKTLCGTSEAFEQAYIVLIGAAYFAPEVAIPKQLLREWLIDDDEDQQINHALQMLRSLSLFEDGDLKESYRIHQVVQDVLKLKLTVDLNQKALLASVEAITAYNGSADLLGVQLIDEKKRISLIALKPHCLALIRELKNLSSLEKFISAEASMQWIVGVACTILGEEKMAKSSFESQLNCYRKLTMRLDSEYGVCLMHLGMAINSCGDSQGAIPLMEEALPFLKKGLSENHVFVGYCLQNLGIAISNYGDSRRARDLFESALTILKNTLSQEHPSVASCLVNIGIEYLESDPAHAKILFEEALPILKAKLGFRDRMVGKCLEALGLATARTGDNLRGKSLLEEALSIIREVYGDIHASVAICLKSLAQVAREHNELVEAKKLFENALSIFMKCLGERHVRVGSCLYELGRISLESGQPKEAKKLLEDALSILKANSIKESKRSEAVCLMSVGEADLQCGNPIEAKIKLVTALQMLKDELGDNHQSVGRCLYVLAKSLSKLNGNPFEVKSLYLEALRIMKSTLGESHLYIGHCLMSLGMATSSCNELQAARVFLEEALAVLETHRGKHHLEVGECLLNLATVTKRIGNYQKARNYADSALKIYSTFYTSMEIELGICLNNAGIITLLCEDEPNAIILLEKALSILRYSLGDHHENVRICRLKLNSARESLAEKSNLLLRGQDYYSAVKTSKANIAARELRKAAAKGSIPDLMMLLKTFPQLANQPDQRIGSGRTPLHWAVVNKRDEHVKLILNCIGYNTIKDAKGTTALEYALQDAHPGILEHFKSALLIHYSHFKISADQLPKLVRICAKLGDKSGLKLLIYLNVPVDEAEIETGKTALRYAVDENHTDCVKLLITAGADPNQKDLLGQSAFTSALNSFIDYTITNKSGI